MGETIAVLIVFFILIMVGMVFYTNFKTKSIERKKLELQDMKAIEIATRVSLLPELQCSESQCIGCTGAIDLIKLDAMVYEYVGGIFSSLPGLLSNNIQSYISILGYSYVKVEVVFPDATEFEDKYLTPPSLFAIEPNYEPPNDVVPIIVWNLYDFKPPGSPEEGYKNYRVKPIFIPVNLFNAYTDECHFGVMEIGVYET